MIRKQNLDPWIVWFVWNFSIAAVLFKLAIFSRENHQKKNIYDNLTRRQICFRVQIFFSVISTFGTCHSSCLFLNQYCGNTTSLIMLSKSQSYQTFFHHKRRIFPFFAINLGHFIIDTHLFICYKHSSLTLKVRKQRKTKFGRIDSWAWPWGKKYNKIANGIAFRSVINTVRVCKLLEFC